MVAKRFDDLICWQLAFKLQEEVFAYTATGPAWRDVEHREQIRSASRSVTRNTAEGFGRFRPKEFARFSRLRTGRSTKRKTISTTRTSANTSTLRNIKNCFGSHTVP